jgi:hypothetical protein
MPHELRIAPDLPALPEIFVLGGLRGPGGRPVPGESSGSSPTAGPGDAGGAAGADRCCWLPSAADGDYLHGTYSRRPWPRRAQALHLPGDRMPFLYSRELPAPSRAVQGRVLRAGPVRRAGHDGHGVGAQLLTIYLGLELLSLSLYAMVAFSATRPFASEAAMKYFVLGALASGMLLYGMSMLYGATGSLDISPVAPPSIAASGRTRAGVRPGVRGGRPGLQARRGAVPHVGAGCLPRRADRGDAVHRHGAQDRRLRHA